MPVRSKPECLLNVDSPRSCYFILPSTNSSGEKKRNLDYLIQLINPVCYGLISTGQLLPPHRIRYELSRRFAASCVRLLSSKYGTFVCYLPSVWLKRPFSNERDKQFVDGLRFRSKVQLYLRNEFGTGSSVVSTTGEHIRRYLNG